MFSNSNLLFIGNVMKFAPVCPIHIYEYLADCGEQFIGNYFLLLAHDVLANQKRYANFFKGRDCTIIMDNSVIELGDACDAKTLVEAAETVDATCFAIPDVLQDGQATYSRADTFFQEYKGMQTSKRFELMYIPQGKNLADYVNCLESGLNSFGEMIDWIGVARNTTGRILPSRNKVMSIVWAMLVRKHLMSGWPLAKIHLLGFSADMQDDIQVCLDWAGYVEGIDSAVPLRMPHITTRHSMIDPGPRGDWWETTQVPKKGVINVAAHNALTIRKIIGEI